MDITKVAAIAIIGILLSTLLKKTNPAIALCTVISACVAIIAVLADDLYMIITEFCKLLESGGISNSGYKSIIKVIGVAYFTEICSGLCKDAGESALAAKLDIAGRICILSFTLPLISELIEVIMDAISLI